MAARRLVVLGLALCAGCGGAQRTSAQSTLVRKCGACHPVPEASRFDRGGWEIVLARHRRRVPMTDAQRAALLDTLAPPAVGQP